MLVRTVSGRGFIKYRCQTIQLTEALAGLRCHRSVLYQDIADTKVSGHR